MTPLNPQEDPALRGDLSPPSIPLSPNYFDALSKVEEEEQERGLTQAHEMEKRDLKRALALSLDPNGKAPMSRHDLEVQMGEEELQQALHLSRVEEEKSLERRKSTSRP